MGFSYLPKPVSLPETICRSRVATYTRVLQASSVQRLGLGTQVGGSLEIAQNANFGQSLKPAAQAHTSVSMICSKIFQGYLRSATDGQYFCGSLHLN